MDLKSFRNKKIIIMGLGLHGGGVGATKFFANLGVEILVTDLKSREELAPSLAQLKDFKIEYILGGHRKEDFKNTDLIIKNPAVPFNSPFLEVARNHKIPIETQTSLFFKLCKGEIIGITGTKGKSTVGTLIYNFLKSEAEKVILAGNIRIAALEKLKEIKKDDQVILELSSFQLENLRMSPKIALITNILEDHLDRYKNMKDYIRAKEEIFKSQKPEDFLILNYNDKICRSLAKKTKSQIYFYSKKKIKERDGFKMGAYQKEKKIYLDKKQICKIEDIKLKGVHNIENVLAAVTVAGIKKVSPEKIKNVLRKFKGLPFRLEFVKNINGVLFYNDTCATCPEATIAALNSFEKKVILIAGGAEKNLPFENLAKEIAEKVKILVLLEGEATKRLKGKVNEVLKKSKEKIPINTTKSMQEAVNLSFKMAKKRDIVLLSPACSSFGMFLHEFDRGAKFNKVVKELEKI